MRSQSNSSVGLTLDDGARVAVIGSGPAGSFFSFFLLDMAERLGRRLHVDIYEPRVFSKTGPASCNMCGGIISESLVQNLAAEGIALPPTVIQRGIDSYVLHMDVGSVRIETPVGEMRIATVYRAAGPRDLKESEWQSFDDFLQRMAETKGGRMVRARVADVAWDDGLPTLTVDGGQQEAYDLVAVAAGVNSTTLKLFEHTPSGYEPPETTKTFIREFRLGRERLREHLGNAMHVFLLDIPGLEFAAVIPKGDYASMCLLGEHIEKSMLDAFMDSDEVKGSMPSDWDAAHKSCQCSPKMAVRGAQRPFADRIVFIGDAGVTRLYKDGIGAAYRTAKAAATAAVFQGVSARHFERHYWPTCRAIERDNQLGRLIFRATSLIQKWQPAREAVLRMVAREQGKPGAARRMSMVLWDLFTGSAKYRDILRRTFHPAFAFRLSTDLLSSSIRSLAPSARRSASLTAPTGGETASAAGLGRVYEDGEHIVREGEVGNTLHVVQEGEVEVYAARDGEEVRLAVRGPGDLIGEMAVFERKARSASVRALGTARVLTLDKQNFLARIHEDPSLALRTVESMSRRIRELSEELTRLKGG
jgi:flavin-dependent dehydrogenase